MTKAFRVTGLLIVVLALVLPSSLGQAMPPTPPLSAQPSPLPEAVSEGEYPAQLAGATGSGRSGRYGPQRTTYENGIPRHAYSPFDQPEEPVCPPGGCDSQPGVVLVKLAPEVVVQAAGREAAVANAESFSALMQRHGVTRVEQVFPGARRPAGGVVLSGVEPPQPVPDLTRWLKVYLDADKAATAAALEAFAVDPSVQVAEPDYLRKPIGQASTAETVPSSSTPLALPGSGTDPLFDQQWHLEATNVISAWQWLEDNGYPPGGSPGILVAVIDTGVDYTHPDLASNMWVNPPEFGGTPGVDDDGNGYVDDIYGADTVYPDGDPQDDHGHGTHVAGIVAAQAENAEGGVGVAYNAKIMALKAAQYSGVLSSSDIAEAIYYAIEKGADVINMSFGGYVRSSVEEDALAVAFAQAVLVAAAGNDSLVNLPCAPPRADMYPAAHNWVLGVMASASGGNRAAFSNYDCTPHDTHEYELMAPGVDVWSTLPAAQYAAWDGTSMSAPIVSGIAALARTRWADKEVYSSRFIMGQIAANASGGTGGVADAHAALAVTPQPELSYLEHWLFDTESQSPDNDDDGIVDAGETVDLAIVIRNHWGKADPVTVTLEAWAEGAVYPDPYVQMITDTISYGAIGSFNEDDNGLVYDQEGAIVEVAEPFRFTVPITTPNDHVIPFLLTMEAGNGYDPEDPDAPYVFEDRFYLIVQRGEELPRIISEDMTLSKDYYWLVPDRTLVEAGVTVTVTEGTQVQFWSADPDDPYSEVADPFWQVEGTLLVHGTVDEPVEMFPSMHYPDWAVEILRVDAGRVELRYGRIVNPILGDLSYNDRLNVVDHCWFGQEGTVINHRRHDDPSSLSLSPPKVFANSISNTRFHKLGYGASKHDANVTYEVCLFDSNALSGSPDGPYNVFLHTGHATSLWISNLGYCCIDCDPEAGRSNNLFRENAILNTWWNPDIDYWMRVYTLLDREYTCYITDNFWSTTSATLIDAAIRDYHDDFNLAEYVYQPVLTTPPAATYPFVADVVLSTESEPDASIVGAEPVTFTVSFNRDMDTAIQPTVSFGPDVPETDYTIHPIDGGWTNARTWVGAFTVTPVTGDGYQLIRVAGAVAADDPWLITGDDAGRFRFEVITSGSQAMNLQATGGEGYVDLMWTQDDFDLLAGFNLYRSTTTDGTYSHINEGIIPLDVRNYRDTNVQPGQPYYYKFTVVKSDMSESGASNTATATPIDTIAPIISHTPVAEAEYGLPLTLYADVTDNVGVQAVTLYHRAIGESSYSNQAMVHTTGDRYSATIAGSEVTAPGLEYYVEADDGVTTVQVGSTSYPYQILVEDHPVVTIVNPDHGPTDGGTLVTISGSNFKAGASVTFGGAVAGDVSVLSTNQITCTTPAHFPETVDVTVTNPDTESGTMLRAFTYQSPAAQLSLPDTGGDQMATVQLPVNAGNVQGLLAADLTVTFDPAVLTAQGASTGSLTPGWSLVANTGTPGQVTLSLASASSVSGSGILAYLEFDVTGSPGVTTTLEFSEVLLNDGAIPAETTDGSFAVEEVYDISGLVTFWNGDAGVPAVELTLEGDRIYTDISQSDGSYAVTGAAAGDYTLTPAKSDEVNGISAYDASFALQHAAGLITLTGHQATAADVNKNGAVTSMDAAYMLQKAVDLLTLPFPGAGVVWDFDPTSRSYTSLGSDLTGQDFTAILLGDITGNWTAMGEMSLRQATADVVVLEMESSVVDASGGVTVTVSLDAHAAPVYSLDFAVSYDPEALTALSVEPAPGDPGWLLAANLEPPGQVLVGLASALPLTESGPILKLHFTLANAGGTAVLEPVWGQVNEGALALELAGCRVGGYQVYLPLIVR